MVVSLPVDLIRRLLYSGCARFSCVSYETSTEHGARSAREQRLANLPAVTDPAGSQYGRTLRTLQHLRKQFVEYGAGLDVTASFDALTHKIIGAQIRRRLSADCWCWAVFRFNGYRVKQVSPRTDTRLSS